jgi:hypothetical protein
MGAVVLARIGERVDRFHSAGTDFTEKLLVSAYAMHLFWALDPFQIQLWRYTLFRHLPNVLLLAALLLNFWGRAIFRRSSLGTLWDACRLMLPHLLLGLLLLAGGSYARHVGNENSTYQSTGFSMLLGGPILCAVILASRAPQRLISAIMTVTVLGAVAAVVSNAVHWGGLIFHGIEHLVIVAVMMPIICRDRGGLFLVSLVGTALSLLAPNKLTGYLVVLTVLCMLYMEQVNNHAKSLRMPMNKSLVRIIGAYVAVGLALAVVVAYFAIQQYLPDGNTEYRMHTYEKAFLRFMDSPLWGTAFSVSAVERFDLFTVGVSTQNLPTHSDLLDLAAHGGLIGLGLYLWAIVSVVVPYFMARLKGPDIAPDGLTQDERHAVFVVICGVVVMAFNPVLLSPSQNFLYWAMSSIALAVRQLRSGADGHLSPACGRTPPG